MLPIELDINLLRCFREVAETGSFTKAYPNVHLDIHTELGTGLVSAVEKGELDLVMAGKDTYQGDCRLLVQEPLIWAMGEHIDFSEKEIIPLVLQPSPCHFRTLATQSLENLKRSGL